MTSYENSIFVAYSIKVSCAGKHASGHAKKYKAHISKYKPYILKYKAFVFCQKACNFFNIIIVS